MITMNTRIKVLILALLFITACSGGSGDQTDSDVKDLALGETETATIATVGDVDTYYLRAAETNRFLNIACNEKSSGSGVDLMVTVYEEAADGTRTRLFGKHKPLNATPPANINMKLYIGQPKDLYIVVRISPTT